MLWDVQPARMLPSGRSDENASRAREVMPFIDRLTEVALPVLIAGLARTCRITRGRIDFGMLWDGKR